MIYDHQVSKIFGPEIMMQKIPLRDFPNCFQLSKLLSISGCTSLSLHKLQSLQPCELHAGEKGVGVDGCLSLTNAM